MGLCISLGGIPCSDEITDWRKSQSVASLRRARENVLCAKKKKKTEMGKSRAPASQIDSDKTGSKLACGNRSALDGPESRSTASSEPPFSSISIFLLMKEVTLVRNGSSVVVEGELAVSRASASR